MSIRVLRLMTIWLGKMIYNNKNLLSWNGFCILQKSDS